MRLRGIGFLGSGRVWPTGLEERRAMKISMRVAVVVLVAGASALGSSGCVEERKAPPPLSLHFKAVTPQGDALPGVSVEALEKVQGQTDAEGKLSFPFTKDVGEEFTVSATLDRP